MKDNSFTNVSNTGFLSTLGPASFREPIQNKIDAKMAKSLIRCRRPPKALIGCIAF